MLKQSVLRYKLKINFKKEWIAIALLLLASAMANAQPNIRLRGVGIDIGNVGSSGYHLMYPKGVRTTWEERYYKPGEFHLWNERPSQVINKDFASTPLDTEDERNCSIDSVTADAACIITIAVPINNMVADGWTNTGVTFSSSISTFTLYVYNYTEPNTWVKIPYFDPHIPTMVFGDAEHLKFDNPLPISDLAEGVVIVDSWDYYNRGSYIVDPHIMITPEGDYIAGRNGYRFISKDKGLTWEYWATDYKIEHSSTFYHDGAYYIIGDANMLSNEVGAITRSTNGGQTWETPVNLNFDLRNAPAHVEISQGRIWMAYELAGSSHRVNIASASTSSNLMSAASWVTTEREDYDPTGNETDMVMGPDGWPIALPKGGPPIVASSESEAHQMFSQDLFNLPGSGSKYTAKYDSVTNKYWALTSYSHFNYNRAGIALWSSSNLKSWTKERQVFEGKSGAFHGFNYPFMEIDGDDVVFVLRTAWENDRGQAQRWHDANMLTFHRIRNFRENCHIIPKYQINTNPLDSGRIVPAAIGDQVRLTPATNLYDSADGEWAWTGPDKFTSTEREIVLTSFENTQAGVYTATFTAPDGALVTLEYTLAINGDCEILPYIKIADDDWMIKSDVELALADRVNFGPQSRDYGGDWGNGWYVSGPDGVELNKRDVLISSINEEEMGTYTFTNIDENWCAASIDFSLTRSNKVRCEILPKFKINDDAVQGGTIAAVPLGGKVRLTPESDLYGTANVGNWSWTGPNGFSASTREINLTNFQNSQVGEYVVTFSSESTFPISQKILVGIKGECSIIPWYKINERDWVPKASIVVVEGDDISFGPWSEEFKWKGGTWSWSGPNNYFAEGREPVIRDIQYTQAGVYTVTNFDQNLCASSLDFTIEVNECGIIPYLNINNEGWNSVSGAEVNIGDEVWFGPQSTISGGADVLGWSWEGPNGMVETNRGLLISNFKSNQYGTYTVSFTDPSGCYSSFQYELNDPLATAIEMVDIGYESDNYAIRIYPDPVVHEKFNLELNNIQASEVMIFNLTGVKISHKMIHNSERILKMELNKPDIPGIYFAKVMEKSGKSYTTKFVVL
ncbi:T9SS type A sorting domain-containing protein [Maribellus sediminis]|uniref:T9SS type A sorting domain-containing protein n=1 Tax=Maribellus sediminis TaxID=2696285 RepID=UPI001430F5C0|nr:T9SS type A sorting domain-containing protein [Maribellus sediminis]